MQCPRHTKTGEDRGIYPKQLSRSPVLWAPMLLMAVRWAALGRRIGARDLAGPTGSAAPRRVRSRASPRSPRTAPPHPLHLGAGAADVAAQGMFPKRDGRPRQVARRYFQIAVILGIEHEHAAEIARVTTDQQWTRPVPRRDPGPHDGTEVGQTTDRNPTA